MHLGEALVPEAHCYTAVLKHGNNHCRNSSSERNCISHSRCLFVPVPSHSIAHWKPDGALSLYLILLFMCFRSFSWVGQLRGLGNKTCQNICPSWLKGQKTVAVYTVFLSNNNMSRVKSWCRILYCFCCWKQRRGREYCILAVEWSRVGQPRRNFGVPVLITVQSTEAKSSFLVQKSCKSSLSLKPFIPFRGKFDDCVKVITSITVFKLRCW